MVRVSVISPDFYTFYVYKFYVYATYDKRICPNYCEQFPYSYYRTNRPSRKRVWNIGEVAG